MRTVICIFSHNLLKDEGLKYVHFYIYRQYKKEHNFTFNWRIALLPSCWSNRLKAYNSLCVNFFLFSHFRIFFTQVNRATNWAPTSIQTQWPNRFGGGGASCFRGPKPPKAHTTPPLYQINGKEVSPPSWPQVRRLGESSDTKRTLSIRFLSIVYKNYKSTYTSRHFLLKKRSNNRCSPIHELKLVIFSFFYFFILSKVHVIELNLQQYN